MDAENDQNVDNALDELMDEIADEIFSESQENIIRYDVINTGFLLRSGNINRSFLEKEIIYSAPYAAVTEFGREPGSMPPLEPIKKWLMQKLRKDEKEAERIAWAIARDILKNGTEARHWMRDAVNTIEFKYGG